jgi:hypothetical protein
MIENLKDLERFFKICRKQGVVKADLANQAFEFGDLPVELPGSAGQLESIDSYAGFPTGELTPEQLMFYSSGGVPADDPELKVG